MKKNKMYVVVGQMVGCFFLFATIHSCIFIIPNFISIEKSITDISDLLFALSFSLFLLTQYYSFDDDNLIYHCFFFIKTEIPIYTIMEIKYYFFGLVILTVYHGMLNQKRKIPISFLCSKKRTIKKMEEFVNLVSRKNNSCVIKM
jgi:hypothetical protein